MKKIFNKISKFIDRAGDVLSRFKTIGAIIILVVLVLSFINGGCNRREANKLLEQVTGLNIQNDVLKIKIENRRYDLLLQDAEIEKYKDLLAAKEKENKELKDNNYRLREQKESNIVEVITIPVDSSYLYLTEVAYPYSGELKYPFNEPQVKFIHLTYLDKLNLEKQKDNLIAQVTNYESQLLLKNTIFEKKVIQLSMAEENITGYKEIIKNKDKEIVLKDKVIKKKKIGNILFKITTVVLAAIAIIK